jgi:hypothetical protein
MQNTHKDLQDSGLHNTPFFTTKYISQDKINMEIDNIEWNRELHREYSIDEDDLTELSEDEIDERVREDFYQDAFIYNYYRQVDKYDYDEEDAYKCKLVPFTIYDYDENTTTYLLGLGGCGMDLSAKLDAYFFLQTGNMDPASSYFRYKDNFKDIVPTEIFNAIEDKFGGVTV